MLRSLTDYNNFVTGLCPLRISTSADVLSGHFIYQYPERCIPSQQNLFPIIGYTFELRLTRPLPSQPWFNQLSTKYRLPFTKTALLSCLNNCTFILAIARILLPPYNSSSTLTMHSPLDIPSNRLHRSQVRWHINEKPRQE